MSPRIIYTIDELLEEYPSLRFKVGSDEIKIAFRPFWSTNSVVDSPEQYNFDNKMFTLTYIKKIHLSPNGDIRELFVLKYYDVNMFDGVQ